MALADDSMTLRAFLEHGLWPIEVKGRAGGSGSSVKGVGYSATEMKGDADPPTAVRSGSPRLVPSSQDPIPNGLLQTHVHKHGNNNRHKMGSSGRDGGREPPLPGELGLGHEPEYDLFIPNSRPPSAQTVRVFAATGGYVTIVQDDGDAADLRAMLEAHLKLDEPVPSDVVAQYNTSAQGTAQLPSLSEEHLLAALSYVYALVNRLVVDPTLRNDPANAHLYTMWHLEGDTTYLARGLEGGVTATSGTADGVCIAQHGPTLHAIAILESKITSLFPAAHREDFHALTKSSGFTVYLSYAADRLRAWNCPLPDGASTFWAAHIAQIHEAMHVYKCNRMIGTSWVNSVVLSRRSANVLACSATLKWGATAYSERGDDNNNDDDDDKRRNDGAGGSLDTSSPRLNLLQAILASAMCTLDDPLERWHRDAVNMIPRPAPALDNSVDSLPPTLPARIVWGHGSELRAHLIQTYPEDEGTITDFLELADENSEHMVQFERGTLMRGQMFTSFRVAVTSFIRIPANTKVIARLFNLGAMPYADTKWSLSSATVRRRVRDEAALYCGVLKELQGETVPRFFGLFEGHYGKDKQGIMVMMMEDCGPPVALMREGLDRRVCTEIVRAYERLHAANVVHGDTGVQHLRHSTRGDGHVLIVDFDNAWVVDPAKKREKADIDDEYRCVLREYGFEVPPHLRELVPPWEMEDE